MSLQQNKIYEFYKSNVSALSAPDSILAKIIINNYVELGNSTSLTMYNAFMKR